MMKVYANDPVHVLDSFSFGWYVPFLFCITDYILNRVSSSMLSTQDRREKASLFK